MPRIKRWFTVSHDINRDPEMWEFRDLVGGRADAIWDEILSISDRNDGELPGRFDRYPSLLAHACHSTPTKVRMALAWLTVPRGKHNLPWVTVESDGIARVTNYRKYHIIQEGGKNPLGKANLSLPSEPSEPSEPNKNKNKSAEPESPGSSVPKPSAVKPWPDEDVWLKTLIDNQTFLNNSRSALDDFAWWEDVAAVLGGIERAFIEKQFAKISAWLKENPGRRPTAKGSRRFLRTWLERAKEQDRRVYAVKR